MHTSTNKDRRWVTFTYISPQIRKATNIFRNTNVKIAFKCRNTIANRIKPSTNHNTPPYNKWGIFQLTCHARHLSYVGQTSRSLSIRFQERIRYIMNNNPQSANAQHILQNQQEYGQMNRIMAPLKPLNNPSFLIPYEQNYIQSLHREGKLIPEQNPGEINLLFKAVINPLTPHATWTDPLCFSLLHGYHPSPAIPKLQHTSKQGRYNLKLTTLEYISKASPIKQ